MAVIEARAPSPFVQTTTTTDAVRNAVRHNRLDGFHCC
jgi:hypothetical protein